MFSANQGGWGGGGGGILAIRLVGVSLGVAGSPNPDPISEQNMSFSTPVFRPDL